MIRRILLLLLAAVALSLAVAACGGDDDEADEPAAEETTEDTGGAGTTLELAADPGGGLSFDPETLDATAGPITINLTNDAQIPHNVAIDGTDSVSETVTGASTSLNLDLEPGEYTYYCAVPGHREGGMEGTLTVE